MSNALTLVRGAFLAHNVLWWNWPSGKSFSCIKLTESMALAVDGNLLFYTSLSGAMVWSCLLDTGVDFTYRLFYIRLHRETSITSRRCLSLSRFQRATEITSPVNLWNGLCASETRLFQMLQRKFTSLQLHAFRQDSCSVFA